MNATLDINTRRGRIAAQLQHRAAEIVFSHLGMTFHHTSDRGAAHVDGVVLKDGAIAYVAEIKTRDATYETLMNQWNGEWLLTMQKLVDLSEAARLLGAPGIGMLYLPQSGMVLVKRLVDEHGKIVCQYRQESTATQATINGGTAHRINAFIYMGLASCYQDVNPQPVPA